MPYILVAGDCTAANGGSRPGKEVADYRLQSGRWPIYSRTPNRRNLQVGDRFLVYVGGRHDARRSFIAHGAIGAIAAAKRGEVIDPPDVLSELPAAVLGLVNVEVFSKPIDIYPLLGSLSFVPKNRTKWGAALHGGCRMISQEDMRLILAAAPTTHEVIT